MPVEGRLSGGLRIVVVGMAALLLVLPRCTRPCSTAIYRGCCSFAVCSSPVACAMLYDVRRSVQAPPSGLNGGLWTWAPSLPPHATGSAVFFSVGPRRGFADDVAASDEGSSLSLASSTSSTATSSPVSQPINSTLLLSRAKEKFSLLSSSRKSKGNWKRFRDLVELTLTYDPLSTILGDVEEKEDANESALRSSVAVADIGTDHGLLPVTLALTSPERYHKVIGVDRSEQALRDGARALEEEIKRRHPICPSCSGSPSLSSPLPLEFRHGDGLRALDKGEADIVVVAGMGVHTMIDILSARGDRLFRLDEIGCQKIVLQPTNIRPRNLILLYRSLLCMGWAVQQERLSKLGPNRWYVTASFGKTSGSPHEEVDADMLLPGWKLAERELLSPKSQWSPCGSSLFIEFLRHYCAWLRKDLNQPCGLSDGEDQWLSTFDKIRIRLERGYE